jgi:hypothetical protein
MKLLAVTYHYVRDPERARFPGLKTCRVEELRAQLRFLASEDARLDEIYCGREGLRRIVAGGHALARHSNRHQHLNDLPRNHPA